MSINKKAAMIAAATLIVLLGLICLLVWLPTQILLLFVVAFLYVCLYRIVILIMNDLNKNQD